MQQKSSSSINLFGFTLLRNGVKYDYSFRESLLSLKPIVQRVYLALDSGEDTTAEELLKLDFIEVIKSPWDMSLKKGLVLSTETNIALNALRSSHQQNNDWGIYLQADEVLHEDDYDLLQKDILYASENGYDAISFRYLHFWQTHHHIAISKKWYPHEIRAIKLNSPIESWGDAQGFRNYNKVFFTEARIFHYGHVREQQSYQSKMRDMGKMYHQDDVLDEKLEKGLKDAKKNRCLKFFGNHPLVMKERILRMNDIWSLPMKNEIYILGKKENYSEELIAKIAARKIYWINKMSEVPQNERTNVVITAPKFMDIVLKKSEVPVKMKSKSARPWSHEFRLILQLSEKNIGLRA